MVIFNGKTHYKWPFSIAMLVYQRVSLVNIQKPMERSTLLRLSCRFADHLRGDGATREAGVGHHLRTIEPVGNAWGNGG